MASDHDKITPYGDVATSKKGQVTKMFDGVAPYYDLLNRVLSLGIDVQWRKKAIKMLAASAPKKILDIATGTADLAIEAAKVIQPESIIGLDISSEMLKIGDKKIADKALNEVIQLELGDSEALRYADGQFDAVMSSFGVRNFENLPKGLAEMNRVLAKGGQCMILEFSRPTAFPLKQLFNGYFKYILPVIGRVKSKDPRAYTYLYESVQAFPDYERFADILKEVGFSEVTWKPLTFGICTIYMAKK